MEKLADMKMSKKDKSGTYPTVAGSGGADYPWGLELNLDNAALKKLGIDELPDAGQEIRIVAVGKATRVSQSAAEGRGSERSLCVQITKMALTTDETGDTDDKAEKFAKGYKKGMGR